MATYRIVRCFRDHPARKLQGRGTRHLTLEQAREHCRDPQTHSQTCTTAAGRRLTAAMGPWFDGYEEERD